MCREVPDFSLLNTYVGISMAMGVPPIAGWFIRGNPFKMDDLGVPSFLETSMFDGPVSISDGWTLRPPLPTVRFCCCPQIFLPEPREIFSAPIFAAGWDGGPT